MATLKNPLNAAAHLRAVVVGLGRAGSRFDEEPGRKVIWSHVGGYLALGDRVALVGAVEVAPDNTAAFQARCPDVPVYRDVGTLIAEQRPQIASICTPPESHAEILSALLKNPELRLVWCEKPLAARIEDAHRMVSACRQRGVKLMVSYNRHWLPLWQRTRALVRSDTLGTVRCVRVAFPNRLLSIGSHAVDLALMLGGNVDSVMPQALLGLAEIGEPAAAALLRYRSGASGIVQVTGLSTQLMIEAEVIGDDGRLLAREDQGSITIEHFAPSQTYAGYRQLGAPRTEHAEAAGFSSFAAMAENAVAAIVGDTPLACDGEHALEVQRVLELMAAAAV